MAAEVEPAVVGLVDDAGIFPPTKLPMADALARHRADEKAASPVHTDRFLVAASRVGEMLELLDDAPIDVGLVVDVPLDELDGVLARLDADERVSVTGIELRWPAGGDAVGFLADLKEQRAGTPIVVELAIDEHLGDRLQALTVLGLGAKVRAGGITEDLFPSTDELERFLRSAVTAGVPFKATAGLHHAVRYVDPETGFQHHGFLNILLAVLRLVDGRPVGDALTSTDGEAMAKEIADAPADVQRATRAMFLAYGSCDTGLPVNDLHALGLA